MRYCLYFALYAAVALHDAEGAGFTVLEAAPHVTVDKTGNGTITLTLRNSTGSTQNAVRLTGSEFEHTLASGTPYRVAGAVAVTPASIPTIADGATAAITLTISSLLEAGDSTAKLLVNGAEAATIVAVRVPAAYNVQLEGQNPEVVFAPDRQAAVRIVNNDATAYHFSWRLVTALPKAPVDVPVLENPEFDLPANSTIQLDLSLLKPQASFLQAGTLKDDVRDGHIVLHPMIAPASAGVPPQSDKWLPVRVRVRYWGEISQQVWAAVCTFALLCLGAVLSLWMHYFIPNTSAMLRMRRQIDGMRARLDGIGEDLAPRWTLLIGAAIARCDAELERMPRTYPAYSNVLSTVETNLAMYSQWLDVAYEVGTALADARMLQQTGAPPTLIAIIGQKITEALSPIESGFTKPDELQSMQAARIRVQQCVASMKSGLAEPELEAAIKDREQRVLADIVELKKDFPDFAMLFEQIEKGAAGTLTPVTYLDRDTFSLQGEYLQHYRSLALRAGITQFPPVIPSADPANAVERIATKDQELRAYVRPEAYKSLSIARIFIAEMRQDFYPPVLLEELTKDSEAIELHADPLHAAPGEPIHFGVRFRRQQLNEIAAIQEWTVRWKFDGVLSIETGWDLYYAFDKAGDHVVEVEFVQLSGAAVAVAKKPTLEMTVGRPGNGSGESAPGQRGVWGAVFGRLSRLSPEAWIEALRLAFALAVVLGGLFSAARGKVENLGLMQATAALIALGFTVNTAKEIVVGKPEVK